jgi:small subunit ribosomal protein S1
MSWSKKVKHPSKILAVNQEVECQVLGIDQEAHRISLGLKQVEANPWEQLAEKYPIGSKLNGKVRNLTEFGAFVEVEEGIDGLIHISDLSWTKRVKHPSEVLKKGDTVEAVVLNIDAENQRLSLGLKQLATDVWEDYIANHSIGEVVEGKIVRVTTFGAFVELAEGVEGLVHVSELDEKRIERPEEQFKPGDLFPMKIIKVQEDDRKIGLSVKAVKAEEIQKDFQAYRQSTGSDRSTIGDILRAQQEAAAKEKEEEE